MTPNKGDATSRAAFRHRAEARSAGISVRRFGREVSHRYGVTSQRKGSTRNCIGAMSAGLRNQKTRFAPFGHYLSKSPPNGRELGLKIGRAHV